MYLSTLQNRVSLVKRALIHAKDSRLKSWRLRSVTHGKTRHATDPIDLIPLLIILDLVLIFSIVDDILA